MKKRLLRDDRYYKLSAKDEALGKKAPAAVMGRPLRLIEDT